MFFFPSLRLAALSIWLSRIQSVLVLQSHRNLRFPPSQFQNRAKTSETLRVARSFLTVQVCFLGLFRKWCHNQRTIALLVEHKFLMADAKNLHFQAQYFHWEGAKVHFNDRNRYLTLNFDRSSTLNVYCSNNRRTSCPSIIRNGKRRTQTPSKSLKKPLLRQKDDDIPQVR